MIEDIPGVPDLVPHFLDFVPEPGDAVHDRRQAREVAGCTAHGERRGFDRLEVDGKCQQADRLEPLGVERLPRPWLLRTLGAVLLVAGAKLLFT